MKRFPFFINLICLVFYVVIVVFETASAEETAIPAAWVSKIVSIQGRAFVKRAIGPDWQPVAMNELFYPGDTLRLAANSRAALVLSNESTLRVDQYTTLVFTGIEQKKTFLMELLEGAAYLFSRKMRSLKVVTPFVNGVVEGTEFYVQVDAEKSSIILYEGAVLAQNPYGDVNMTKGQAIIAPKGQSPRLANVAHPRDAVQWALYYPPIVAFHAEDFPVQDKDDWTTKIHNSIQFLEKGDLTQAFSAIEGLGDTVKDPRFFTYRAGLHLAVGNTSAAQRDLGQAMAMDKNNSAALALRAVVAVIQNRKESALIDARLAVNIDPQSAPARMALSYAQQARFDLQGALETMQKAVAADPENGIAWARLAELYLSTGNLKKALGSAQKAEAMAPRLAHVQTVLGYAYLTQIKTQNAKEAFNQAIALDSAAPLPRLGLGLATIRDGHLKEGRAEIEIAVGLDAGNALLRSYLGKAYFDEKRDGLDERQFGMAKRLDPNDPTPWFYDAIRKQSLNRPGEALRDMQQAIELNDNRAVYRSRLMLDEDLATRSASLGRIYNDLSFEGLALHQGWKSLEADPANYSAHRLLADMYASQPRHEIARVSELLQSQLLQPLNLTPMQPQLAEINPLLLESSGPAGLGMNEFNQLFVRDRIALQATGVVGEQATLADEVTLAGLKHWFSYSIGQSHYHNDGFRENDDLDNDLYNAFVQAAVSPSLGLQAEYRNRDTDSGDLRLRFDPEFFSADRRYTAKENSLRLGVNYNATLHGHLLCSLIFRKSEYKIVDKDENSDSFSSVRNDIEVAAAPEAKSGELQYLWHGKRQNVIVGAGYLEEDRTTDVSLTTTVFVPPSAPMVIGPDISSVHDLIKHGNGYLYYYFQFNRNLVLTLAGAYDDLDQRYEQEQRVSPKGGIVWTPNPAVTLRAAWFQTVKRQFNGNQTLEPTQIAGFNQFFDDTSGALTERYGAGIDFKLTTSIQGGLEYTKRDIESPIQDSNANSVYFEDGDEEMDRAYIYWMLSDRWSLSMEGFYEVFKQSVHDPDELTNIHTPLTLAYFHPAGLSGKLVTTYVNQEVNYQSNKENDDFWVVDASISYRMPNRRGMLTLGARNVLDQPFNYQDVNFNTGEPVIPSFFPERLLYFRVDISI